MEDLRRQKSRIMLRDAFWKVLKGKPYHNITIADVIKEARVNRKTFYAYYSDVEDLMKSCLKDLFEQALMPFASLRDDDLGCFARSTAWFTKYVLEHHATFQLIFQNHLDGYARQIWKSLYYTSQVNFPGAQMHATNPEDPVQDLYYNYSTYASWGNLLWICDHPDLPLETLVNATFVVFRQYMSDCEAMMNV